MHNFVLFCKSYIGDVERIAILKNSIDQFNVDKIPFCIVCPQNDISIFREKLINGQEKYPIYIFSDEEVLQKLGIGALKQNWILQQIIKLGFYKMDVCNHYSILDSECYFINDFCISDFMYDEKTPYIFINVYNKPNEQYEYIQKYFGRKGYSYNFILNSQVFSRIILESLEQEVLNKQNITFENLINMSPYEFNWYGEYYLKCELLPIYLRGELIKVFWSQEQYINARNSGLTVQDFVNNGYKAILLQNRWVKDFVYKPHYFYKFIQVFRHSRKIIQADTKSKNIGKKFEYYIKNLVRENLKILISKK